MTEADVIADLIRRAKEFNLSFEQLAARLDPPVRKGTVHKWRTGAHSMKLKTYVALCNLLDAMTPTTTRPTGMEWFG